MKIILPHLLKATFVGAALLVPLTIAPTLLRAQNHSSARTYHDNKNNDDHEWNAREDKAYGAWAKETHRKKTTFSRLKDDDQQAYWGWRHEHSDAQLKIDIR
jgi:hypothetical protein